MNRWQLVLVAMSSAEASRFDHGLTALETHALRGLVRSSPRLLIGTTDTRPGHWSDDPGTIGKVLRLVPGERAGTAFPLLDADLRDALLNAIEPSVGDPHQDPASLEHVAGFLADHMGCSMLADVVPPERYEVGVCPLCSHVETDHVYWEPDEYCDGWAHCKEGCNCWRSWPPLPSAATP
jgi:hypothetical protein